MEGVEGKWDEKGIKTCHVNKSTPHKKCKHYRLQTSMKKLHKKFKKLKITIKCKIQNGHILDLVMKINTLNYSIEMNQIN